MITPDFVGLYMKATNDVNGLIFKDEVYDIKKQAAKHSYQGIEAILEALEERALLLRSQLAGKIRHGTGLSFVIARFTATVCVVNQ